MANQAALEKIFADEAFARTLAKMETAEEVCEALNAKGAEVTLEEVKAIGKAIAAQAKGELDEAALKNVAGGVGISIGEKAKRNQTITSTTSSSSAQEIVRLTQNTPSITVNPIALWKW